MALATMPGRMPSGAAWGNAILLGVLSTALAYLMYFRLLASLGPTGAVTVTFLVPAFAMLWGWIFRSEQVTGRMLAGAIVILAGTGLTTGLIDLRWLGQMFSRRAAVRAQLSNEPAKPGEVG
jgi:drug/metabolite transporter (DMT)-like permease